MAGFDPFTEALGLAKRIGVNLRGDTVAALDVLSARTGYAPGVLAREAVEAGLPVVRDKTLAEELRTEARRLQRIGFQLPEQIRYNERTAGERVNGRLKDEFGGRHVRDRYRRRAERDGGTEAS